MIALLYRKLFNSTTLQVIIILLLCYECGQHNVLREKSQPAKWEKHQSIPETLSVLKDAHSDNLCMLYWSNNVAAESTVAFTVAMMYDLINHFI